MQQIADVVKTPTLVPATLEIVDIAGLVKGASKGAFPLFACFIDLSDPQLSFHVPRLLVRIQIRYF